MLYCWHGQEELETGIVGMLSVTLAQVVNFFKSLRTPLPPVQDSNPGGPLTLIYLPAICSVSRKTHYLYPYTRIRPFSTVSTTSDYRPYRENCKLVPTATYTVGPYPYGVRPPYVYGPLPLRYGAQETNKKSRSEYGEGNAANHQKWLQPKLEI